MALAVLSAPAPPQAIDEPPDKVSNDRPDRPLQMPAASSETKEAFDDFERFSRRGSWERATKALYAIPEAQAGRFVDGQDGFIISVARKRRAVLSALSPEGQAAYRLFYDSDAKKLFDQAEGPTEQATLERLYSSYFLSSVGDNAADRLGDLYFEMGQYDRAADCWLSILRERADSELSPALLTVKSAMALARADRRAELDALRDETADRFADEVVTIGNRKAKVADHIRDLKSGSVRAKDADASSSATSGVPPLPSESVQAAWQLKFAASVTAGMTPVELTQWESMSLSGAVPASTIEGKTLYANYLGYVFAIDLASGKMLWRSGSFHNLEQSMMQGQGQMIDAKRFAIIAAPGFVWSLGRDLKDMNFQAPARLICRRAETGEVVWQSPDLSDYTGMELVGQPILARGTMFVAGKSSMAGPNGQENTPHQYVLAIRPHDGKLLWKADIGVFREGQRYYYYGMGDDSPQPRLTYHAGSVYIDTHNGVLGRVDAESGAVDWGYGYPTDAVQSQYGRVFFINGMPSTTSSQVVTNAPLLVGNSLLVKGAKSDRICAIDPDRMKLLWERPIAKSARLIGADDRGVYLGGPELGALDPKTRALRWSTPLPGGSEAARVLVRPDGIWQLTPRGVFEVDPQSGQVRRIFRGDDAGSSGGDLLLTDRWLVAISNQTISAYPRGAAGADRTVRDGAAAPRTGESND